MRTPEFMQVPQEMEKNTIASFYVNLTTNCLRFFSAENPTLELYDQTDTADSLFDAVRAILLMPEDLAHCAPMLSRAWFLDAFQQGKSFARIEFRCRNAQGRIVWLRMDTEFLRNSTKEGVETLVQFFDIDYEKNAQLVVNTLIDSDYEFLGLFDAATGYLMVFGENRDSDGMARNGSNYDQEMPRIFQGLIQEVYYRESVRIMERAHILEELRDKPSYTCSFLVENYGCTRAGRKQWRFSYLDESKSQVLMTRMDITDAYNAERDELTGLFNRLAFYRHVRKVLQENPAEHFILIRCDIDRFKTYNDTYGIQAGDKLLAQIGQRMRGHRWSVLSIFGRIDADHFCALLPVGTSSATQVAEHYRQWIKRQIDRFRLTVSVGAYEITCPDLEVSLMCDRALLALKTVKAQYDQKLAWYDDSLRNQLMREQELVDDMEDALQRGQFEIYFQPQVNCETGNMIGAEALVRWNHPQRGLMPPDEFIPLFEKNGFILKLDAFVWEKSCAYLRTWLDQDMSAVPLSISVNISRYNLYDKSLCSRILALVRRYRLDPTLLKLEITESAYMEQPLQLLNAVEELQRAGFIVEMDDFGAGYSSLNILKDVSVDILKLDIRFLSNGKDGVRGGLILSSVVRMARWLGLPVIVEGVETATQMEYLRSLNCFYMQGYYFGRPMPAAAFEAYLKRKKIENIGQETSTVDFVNTLWDPEAQMSLVFNRLVGSAAILEYCNDEMEIIRANDQFYRTFETKRDQLPNEKAHALDPFIGADRAAYVDLLHRAISSGREEECEVKSLPMKQDGRVLWTYHRVFLLSKNEGCYLFFLAVENITERKWLEEQLRGRAMGRSFPVEM